MSSFAVILPAAGQSSRFQSGQKKPFVDLNGRAVWIRSLEAFVSREEVVQALVVVAADDLDEFRERFKANLPFLDVEVVVGGESRMESVSNGLAAVRPEIEYVAIHDAARPLIASKWIDDVFAAAMVDGAAIPAVRVASTLKREAADGTIDSTVAREGLWAAQTPQVFRRDLLVEAYAKRGDLVATDEAQLVEQLGHGVRLVPGSPMNIKITTQEDLDMARALLKSVPQDDMLDRLHPFSEVDPKSIRDKPLDFDQLVE
ncbi:MAG: 2-C-methyl-D-erythritol 4-phosphate cytidylyltransferase [Planctomycetaceae bacterium]